jgi:hypothetical protein
VIATGKCDASLRSSPRLLTSAPGRSTRRIDTSEQATLREYTQLLALFVVHGRVDRYAGVVCAAHEQ